MAPKRTRTLETTTWGAIYIGEGTVQWPNVVYKVWSCDHVHLNQLQEGQKNTFIIVVIAKKKKL
jgi:hypothetical protein